jgi:hypothetical protein
VGSIIVGFKIVLCFFSQLQKVLANKCQCPCDDEDDDDDDLKAECGSYTANKRPFGPSTATVDSPTSPVPFADDDSSDVDMDDHTSNNDPSNNGSCGGSSNNNRAMASVSNGATSGGGSSNRRKSANNIDSNARGFVAEFACHIDALGKLWYEFADDIKPPMVQPLNRLATDDDILAVWRNMDDDDDMRDFFSRPAEPFRSSTPISSVPDDMIPDGTGKFTQL